MRKKLSFFATAVLLTTLSTVFLSCEDESERGKQAAIDYCECVKKGKSKETCDKELTSKYGKTAASVEDFRDSFNAQGEACGVTIYWETY